MTDITFAPGRLTYSDTCAVHLSPGERVAPLTVLERYWAGDRNALANWLDETDPIGSASGVRTP